MDTCVLQAGLIFGSYEIRDLIGRGGMATVYRAYDHNLQRMVALKFLNQSVAAHPALVAQFRQEAHILARLRHPHIVQIYDFCQIDPYLFMVQELLPGPSLATRLAELASMGAAMPRREVVSVVRQAATALDAVHAAGLVHGDLKPANLIWNSAGTLTLIDFGLASRQSLTNWPAEPRLLGGTPAYASPEHARGEPLTPASDIYSLGVVLYELIAGRPPFQGSSPETYFQQHLHSPVPALQHLRRSIDQQVERLVRQALAKRPADRCVNAGALASALEQSWPGIHVAHAQQTLHQQETIIWHPQTQRSAPAARQIQPSEHMPIRPQPRVSLLSILVVCVYLLLGGIAMMAWQQNRLDAPSVAAPRRQDSGEAPIGRTGPAIPSPLTELRAQLGARLVTRLEPEFSTAEQALDTDDYQQKIASLQALQQRLMLARQDGQLSEAVLVQSLTAIHQIATSHSIDLPLPITP